MTKFAIPLGLKNFVDLVIMGKRVTFNANGKIENLTVKACGYQNLCQSSRDSTVVSVVNEILGSR